jgi:hypothetical protein
VINTYWGCRLPLSFGPIESATLSLFFCVMAKLTHHISPIELLEVLEAFSSSACGTRNHRGRGLMPREIEPQCLEDFLARVAQLSDRVEALGALVAGHHIDPWITPADKVFSGPLFAKVLEVAAVAPLHGQNITPRFDPVEFVRMLVAFDYAASAIC